jgi:hypothetical protein
MKCAEVKAQLREYLEDLHGEPARDALRRHLSECPLCSGFMFQIGAYASDLMKIAQAPVPFDLTDAYLHDAVPKKTGFKIFTVQNLRGVAIFLAVLLLVGAGLQMPRLIRWVQSEINRENAEKDTGDPVSLQLLKQIAADLGVPTDRPFVPEKAAEEKKSPAAAMPVKLRPFHWHLAFSDAPAKEAFFSKLKELKAPVLFQSFELVIFEADRAGLTELTRWMTSSKRLSLEGVNVNIQNLPSFEPVRISALILAGNAPQAAEWHLHFTLYNWLSFQEWLKKENYSFEYESAELWVVKIRNDFEYVVLKEGIRTTRGLIVEMGMTENASAVVPGKVILYIRE